MLTCPGGVQRQGYGSDNAENRAGAEGAVHRRGSMTKSSLSSRAPGWRGRRESDCQVFCHMYKLVSVTHCIADFTWTYTVIKKRPKQPQQQPQQHTETWKEDGQRERERERREEKTREDERRERREDKNPWCRWSSWTSARCRLPGFGPTKKSCFRCGFSRADSDRMSSNLEKNRGMCRLGRTLFFADNQQQSFVPPMRRSDGPRAPSEGSRSHLGEPWLIKQVIELLKNLGFDDSVVEIHPRPYSGQNQGRQVSF